MNNDYTDIFIALYDILFAQSDGDEEFFRYCIEQKKGYALEIGSGTGRLLLQYQYEGLFVEGIEPSEMMIELCKKSAIRSRLQPVIYRQTMQELQLFKWYETIYIPRCTFQLIIDRSHAQQVLKKIYDHLVPGGQLLVPMFIPWSRESSNNTWRLRCSSYVNQSDVHQYAAAEYLMRERIYDCDIVVSESINDNWFEQIQMQHLKIELIYKNGLSKHYVQTTSMRWYHRFEFEHMLHTAGFRAIEIYDGYSHIPASDNTTLFVWHVIK